MKKTLALGLILTSSTFAATPSKIHENTPNSCVRVSHTRYVQDLASTHSRYTGFPGLQQQIYTKPEQGTLLTILEGGAQSLPNILSAFGPSPQYEHHETMERTYQSRDVSIHEKRTRTIRKVSP